MNSIKKRKKKRKTKNLRSVFFKSSQAYRYKKWAGGKWSMACVQVCLCGFQKDLSKLALNKRLTCMSSACCESTRQKWLHKQAWRWASRQAYGEQERHPEVAFLPAEVSQDDRQSWSGSACQHSPEPHAILASLDLTRASPQQAERMLKTCLSHVPLRGWSANTLSVG